MVTCTQAMSPDMGQVWGAFIQSNIQLWSVCVLHFVFCVHCTACFGHFCPEPIRFACSKSLFRLSPQWPTGKSSAQCAFCQKRSVSQCCAFPNVVLVDFFLRSLSFCQASTLEALCVLTGYRWVFHNVVTMETSATGWPPWLITFGY